jgi:hypothetical protein
MYEEVYVPAKSDTDGTVLGPAWFKNEETGERILLVFSSRQLMRAAFEKSLKLGGELSRLLAQVDLALLEDAERIDADFGGICLNTLIRRK